jgi:hypothetical protein
VSLLGSVPGRVSVLVAESARAACCARRRHGEPGARGGRVGGLPQAGPLDDGRSVAAGMETSWRTERQQLKPGQNTQQSPDSQLADRPPDSRHGMPGAVEHRGGLDRTEWSAPGRRIQGRGRAAGAGRAGGSLDWTLVGGRRQLLRLPGVDVRSCISRGRIAAGVGRSPGTWPRSGRCLHRRGQPPRCPRRLIHQGHAVTA